MKKLRGSAGRWLAGSLVASSAAVLVACGGGGGGGDGSGGVGTLSMSMTDQPGCGYKEVWVTVESVRAQGPRGWEEIVPPNGPVQVNLLELTNGTLEDLGAAQVMAGTYEQVRLVLAANTGGDPANYVILDDNSKEALDTPSAAQSGLKLKTNFDVEVGGSTSLLLDFDACTSIVKAGQSGKYILKPVLRLSSKPTGSITGFITTTMSLPDTYVTAQQGGKVLRSTVPGADGAFKLGYLLPGDYTVVITSKDSTTGLVSSVPVTTSTTALPGYIALPASSVMNTVTGTVTTGDAKVLATVTAAQAVSGGSLIEVLGANADYDTGLYTLRLPGDAPLSAPYAANALTFGADGTAGGKYTLKATTATGATKSAGPLDPATASPLNFSFP